MVIGALRETISAYSKNHMKFINPCCEQYVCFVNVNARGIYSSICALKGICNFYMKRFSICCTRLHFRKYIQNTCSDTNCNSQFSLILLRTQYLNGYVSLHTCITTVIS
jgi:hypothetical protein